jgi:hypothetical protein
MGTSRPTLCESCSGNRRGRSVLLTFDWPARRGDDLHRVATGPQNTESAAVKGAVIPKDVGKAGDKAPDASRVRLRHLRAQECSPAVRSARPTRRIGAPRAGHATEQGIARGQGPLIPRDVGKHGDKAPDTLRLPFCRLARQECSRPVRMTPIGRPNTCGTCRPGHRTRFRLRSSRRLSPRAWASMGTSGRTSCGTACRPWPGSGVHLAFPSPAGGGGWAGGVAIAPRSAATRPARQAARRPGGPGSAPPPHAARRCVLAEASHCGMSARPGWTGAGRNRDEHG